MAPLTYEAKNILRSYGPAIRRQLTAWLESYKQTNGTELTLEDINIGVYKVLESLENPSEFDTGVIDDVQGLIDRNETVTLKEFISERSLAQASN